MGFESVLELVVLKCVRCKTFRKKGVSFHVLLLLWMYQFEFYLPIVVSAPYWNWLPSLFGPDDDTMLDFMLLLLL